MKIVGFHLSQSGKVRDVSEIIIPIVVIGVASFIPPLNWATFAYVTIKKFV